MFEKNHLESWLASISKHIAKSTSIYLIGGCALSFKGLKERTKDIDLIITSKTEFNLLSKAMLEAGFTPETDLQDEFYLTALAVYKKEESRIDLFLNKVAQMLSFTSGMKKRSKLHQTYGKLKVYLTSNEDIFLFKSMTTRPGDIKDCELLIQTGLAWDVVLNEIAEQSKGKDKWFFWTFEKVCLIENESNISIPIKAKLLELVKKHWEYRPSDFMSEVKDPDRHLRF